MSLSGHKILDIIAISRLLGMTVLRRVTAERSGHLLHAAPEASLLGIAPPGILDLPAPANRSGLAYRFSRKLLHHHHRTDSAALNGS